MKQWSWKQTVTTTRDSIKKKFKKEEFQGLFKRQKQRLEINPPSHTFERKTAVKEKVVRHLRWRWEHHWLSLLVGSCSSWRGEALRNLPVPCQRQQCWTEWKCELDGMEGGSGDIRERTTRQEIKLYSTVDNSLLALTNTAFCSAQLPLNCFAIQKNIYYRYAFWVNLTKTHPGQTENILRNETYF